MLLLPIDIRKRKEEKRLKGEEPKMRTKETIREEKRKRGDQTQRRKENENRWEQKKEKKRRTAGQEEEKTRTKRREEKKWVSTATADKNWTDFLSNSSPLIEPTLPPLLFLLFCPLAECLSPGQPTYHYGNPLNHSEMHKKTVISLVTGQLPYQNHIS